MACIPGLDIGTTSTVGILIRLPDQVPDMVASQTGSQGIDWWFMAALSTAAIEPLVFIGIFLERYIVKGLTAGAVE